MEDKRWFARGRGRSRALSISRIAGLTMLAALASVAPGCGGGGGGTSCTSVCDHLASLCGGASPSCMSGCAMASAAQRACAANASTCDEGVRCGQSAGTDAGSTTTSDAGSTSSGTECSNGLPVGQGFCEGGGNTLVACRRRGAALESLRKTCGGATPSCAATGLADGTMLAACCPDGNVGEPQDTACTDR